MEINHLAIRSDDTDHAVVEVHLVVLIHEPHVMGFMPVDIAQDQIHVLLVTQDHLVEEVEGGDDLVALDVLQDLGQGRAAAGVAAAATLTVATATSNNAVAQTDTTTAEQIVDSLFTATGCTIDVEELTFVHDGRRPIGKRQSLGKPTRAWMFASLNNERDRPSLSLPRARVVADVLEAFGWNGSRQKPIHQRETDPNVLQPGVLANGTLAMTLTRSLKSWLTSESTTSGRLSCIGRPT